MFEGLDEDAKLEKVTKLFGETESNNWEQYREHDQALAFYNGAQWSHQDLEVLKEQRRPAFTFNLIHSKIQTAVGMNEDNRREAIAAPRGANDRVVAEVVNAVMAEVREEANLADVDSEIYEDGLITGEAALNMSVRQSGEVPGHIEVRLDIVPGRELAWDTGSRRRDRSDSRHVFWSRWVTKDEFLLDYPEFEAEIDELFTEEGYSTYGQGQLWYESDEAYVEYNRGAMRNPSLINMKKREVRLVHFEYKTFVPVYELVGPNGEVREVPAEVAERVRESGANVQRRLVEEVRWIEFIPNKILYDGPSLEPYDGYSVIPFVCYRDGRTGYTYGLVRKAEDPQRDVNKAQSQSIEHIIGQSKPGFIAEKGAVEDVQAFEDQIAQAGSTAIVNDGALTGGQIKDRSIPLYSDAAAKRLQFAMEILDRVMGIATEVETSTTAAQEAAATHMLREKRSLRGMRPVLKNYHRYQREVARRLIETISRAMPDDQIQQYLGQERYKVQDGMIMDAQRQAVVPIQQLRMLRANIELVISDDHEMQRLAQADLLERLATNGVPVDPEVRLELVSTSRSVRERLTQFLKVALQQQAQAAEQARQDQREQIGLLASVEAAKVQQKERESQRDSANERVSDATDALLKLLAIWEKADASEKPAIEAAMRSQGSNFSIQ